MVPAAGVIATKPVIMPWTAPITEGFPKKMTSRMSHVNKLVAAATCVFNTAKDASMLAAYGSPPLNPDHPIHRSPAPANIRSMLFGGNLSLSLVDLGPTCDNISLKDHHRKVYSSIESYSFFLLIVFFFSFVHLFLLSISFYIVLVRPTFKKRVLAKLS